MHFCCSVIQSRSHYYGVRVVTTPTPSHQWFQSDRLAIQVCSPVNGDHRGKRTTWFQETEEESGRHSHIVTYVRAFLHAGIAFGFGATGVSPVAIMSLWRQDPSRVSRMR